MVYIVIKELKSIFNGIDDLGTGQLKIRIVVGYLVANLFDIDIFVTEGLHAPSDTPKIFLLYPFLVLWLKHFKVVLHHLLGPFPLRPDIRVNAASLAGE